MLSRSTIMDSNSFSVLEATGLEPELLARTERRQTLLSGSYRLFYKKPVHLVSGKGAYLFDADGEKYLDVYNNVASVGHCNEKVVAAVTAQLKKLNTHTRYLHDGILNYSAAILATFPNNITKAMFLCTGSEANDLAVRMAQTFTGKTGIVVTAEAYHGNTDLVSQLSPALGSGQTLHPAVRVISPPNAFPGDSTKSGERFARSLQSAINDLNRHGFGFAAFLADSIFSSDGIYPGDPGMLKPAIEVVHQNGGLFIADEVQPGFTRTGEAFWGYARHKLDADLVTTGKPMGNGMPISGLFGKDEIMDSFAEKIPYFNTFGGNPVSIASANAVLNVIKEENLLNHATQVGALFLNELNLLAKQTALIKEVRGTGLYIGVEICDPDTGEDNGKLALQIVELLRENRILTSVCGPNANVLKLRPPLVFSTSDLEWFLTEFEKVLRQL